MGQVYLPAGLIDLVGISRVGEFLLTMYLIGV